MNTAQNSSNWRWVRRQDDKVVAGVASSLARQFDVEPWVIRVVWALAGFVTFGGAVILYLACAISFPREDKVEAVPKKILLGVCSRIHQRGDVEVGLARLIALTLLLATGGIALIGYIVLYFVLSEQPNGKSATN